MRCPKVILSILLLEGIMLNMVSLPGSEVLTIDFSKKGHQPILWHLSNNLKKVDLTPSGIEFYSIGPDPYSISPEYEIPSDKPLFLEITLKCDNPGSAQLFYYQDRATEENSIRFPCYDKDWSTLKVPLPKLWKKTRFRFDPPPGVGKTTLKKLTFSERSLLEDPDFTLRPPPPIQQDSIELKNGDLSFIQSKTSWNNCRIKFRSKIMAMTHPGFRIIIQRKNGEPTAFEPSRLLKKRNRIVLNQNKIESYIEFIDPDRDTWRILRVVSPIENAPGFKVSTSIQIGMDKKLLYFPAFKIFLPKDPSYLDPYLSQATVPGVEYLSLESSSSEKDLIGPQSWRKLPKENQMTWPMMSIARDGIYTSLVWDDKQAKNSNLGPLFDSPDRIFNTGGHVMGMIMPRNQEFTRPPKNILPYKPILIPANTKKSIDIKVFVEEAASIIPAIERYSEVQGLPKLQKRPTFKDYVENAAYGWLRSQGRTDNGFRHALWLDAFKPAWRLDTACFQLWLALNGEFPSKKPAIREELIKLSEKTISQAGISNSYDSTLGHIRGIWPALVLGEYDKIHAPAKTALKTKLGAFKDNYRIQLPVSKKKENQMGLGETHDLDSTNGHSANHIADVLELSILTGDSDALKVGLEKLEQLNREGIRVPRGAQPWEVPFHTPDILASAYLMRANNTAYVATGDKNYLEISKNWAWSGLPFTYLNRDPNLIGNYSTIPGFGATHYIAPNWIGLPVQWCGLVYAHQLYLLNEFDRTMKWKTLADGITTAGIQHTWPVTDKNKGGLLPDYFNLDHQFRDGPAINPGTLQINIPYLYNLPKLYNISVFPDLDLSVLTGASLEEVRGSITNNGISLKCTPQLGMNNLCLIHNSNIENKSHQTTFWTAHKSSQNPTIKKISKSLSVIEINSPVTIQIQTFKIQDKDQP